MKKKVIAIVCAVAVLAAAGGGVTWHFLGNSTKEDDNVVYVNTVKALTNLGTGNGMENRYAGVVESENTWKVEKNSEKTVKEVYVEVGQEVQVGTPLFSYDTEKFQNMLIRSTAEPRMQESSIRVRSRSAQRSPVRKR